MLRFSSPGTPKIPLHPLVLQCQYQQIRPAHGYAPGRTGSARPFRRSLRRMVFFRWLVLDLAATGSETHPLRFDAETGQQRDNDCDTRRYAREPDAELVVEVRSDACLQRHIDRGEQIAELVDDAGERAARIRGRKLIEMGRNDAPRALDHELHQKSPNREQNGAAGEGPKRHDRQ
jgi:hypothetical protein